MNTGVKSLLRLWGLEAIIGKRFSFKIIVEKVDTKKKIKNYYYENKFLFGDIIKEPQKIITDETNKDVPIGKEVSNGKSKKIIQFNVKRKTTGSAINASEQNISSDKDEPIINSFPLCNSSKPLYDETKSPLITNVRSSDSILYPSVTVILRETMSDIDRLILERWKQRLITEMGEEGFAEYNKNQIMQGTLMHEIIKNYLLGRSEKDLLISAELEGCWKSLQSVLSLLNKVVLLESPVVHSQLKYKGILDCVAHFKDKTVLIDWKKSEKIKSDLSKTYDAPVQLSAYMGALNYDDNYPFMLNEALVIVVYTTGSKADVFHLNSEDCAKYWKSWLLRLVKYSNVQKARSVIT